MSNPNADLSEIATQKLQQVHHLVLQFQALESDLRDTFEEIEKQHQSEVKRLQSELNKLKGIEESESNANPIFGATQMKQNPLSSQSSNQMAPNYSNQNSAKNQMHQQLVNSHSNGAVREPSASVTHRFNEQPPGPMPAKQQNHWQNKGSMYNPQQQQNGSVYRHPQQQYKQQSMTPVVNGSQYSYGNRPLPQMQQGGKSLPPAPSSPAYDNSNNNNNNNGNGAYDMNNGSGNDANKKKNVFSGIMNKFSNNGSSGGNDDDAPLATLDGLGGGISERDFYKKYWIEAGKIGEGAFARVRKITRKSDKQVFALKMIKKKGKSSEDIAALQREILVLQKCDHENIVRLGDWCDTKKRIYMVVEFCDGGDVFERVVQYKKFSEKSAIHVVQQVASGMGHVHAMGYVHRDLKPDNLMYLTKAQDSKIKIIDFGLAGDCSNGGCKTPCGTAHYAAPEVLSSLEYDTSADMWSLGVIIYTLLCGFPPFFDASNNMKNLYHLIKKGQYSFPSPFWDDITENAKDLIRKLLVKDPKGRLTAEQVLKHPWVANASNAPDKDLGNQYVQQMSHWQSTRQATEFGLGQEAPPPPPPDQPINLFYNQYQNH